MRIAKPCTASPTRSSEILGAEIVIAVDATFPPDQAEITNFASVLFQSFTVATQCIKEYELSQAKTVIRPEIRSSAQLGLADHERVMAAGERAACGSPPELRQRLAAFAR